MLKASSRLVKPISPIEKGLLGPAPIEKQPSTPSTFKNPPPHLETLPAPLLSPPASQKSSSEGSTKSTAVVSEVGSQEDGQGHELHELLVQETLRLLAEKAALQAEAQEKGRMVDRLERHVAMLQQELDEMHSR